MEDYKIDVINTRKGCLGSSDGKLLGNIASLGYVPKSAHKRLAVLKGLIPHTEIPQTAAIRTGNEIEMAIYHHLKENDDRWESNVKWVSKKYSTPNCTLISHPDLILKDEEKQILNVYEIKTTHYSFDQTRNTYSEQLFIHNILAQEEARKLGRDWKVRVFLCVYSTNGLDLNQGVTFEPERLTIKQIHFTRNQQFDIQKAMQIVDSFLETFDEYFDGDEILSDYLPTQVKAQFDKVTFMLTEIKEREEKVEEFKKMLYDFMVSKNIKTIKNDSWNIVRVDPTESVSFDSKRYMDDMQKNHPRKAKKIQQEYKKITKRNGYAQIKIKQPKV